jgi:hypothetical protein
MLNLRQAAIVAADRFDIWLAARRADKLKAMVRAGYPENRIRAQFFAVRRVTTRINARRGRGALGSGDSCISSPHHAPIIRTPK